MNILSINQHVYIRRSDGRIHEGVIVKLDSSRNNIVTVEWQEGQAIRGKELPLISIVKQNPQIFKATANGANIGVVPPSVVVTATPRNNVVLMKIERMRLERERRSKRNNETRMLRQLYVDEDLDNTNWEFARMLRLYRLQTEFPPVGNAPRSTLKKNQIVVCVRKRPINSKEINQHELDVVSVPNRELLLVHAPRKHLDLTKFLEHHSFRFDHTFDEQSSNAQVYERTVRPLVHHIFDGGMATCFAYGQTGSGKTHTMEGEFTDKKQNSRDGIYALAAAEVFEHLQQPSYSHFELRVSCSFFELYGPRVYDLLGLGKPQLRVLEDGKQRVQVVNLIEEKVANTDEVLHLLELGNSVRTSGQTSANAKSSRSHAVFQIVLRSGDKVHGKISLIDLAGNERGVDNCCISRESRFEGSEINKSLLALKECIRALGRQSAHLPFRSSKLTQVLRDSFIGGKKVRTCMIAMISPGSHSVENTLNTLRYADRVKELTTQPFANSSTQSADPVLEQNRSLSDINSTSN
ncbi:kinesin-like protein Klp59C [Drosophila grimshawi]|uniref:Kinesin-like protein n=1 Tax=Drosophila grimshawi TaxID=7222 RepID=B4JWK5_DROGR|nr:kinesin-like protein Klp59C [Drosophila grimshawi]EDV98343.1 GH22721 [Drosophila grimshawi]